MAICERSKRSLIRLSFCIIFVFLEIVQNCCARTTAAAYTFGIKRVDICPQNQTEWEEASRRLNCSDDFKNPLNRYHCLPVHDLTTLMEFCYSQTRPQVVEGICMMYVQEKNILDGYNCTTFDDGCPDMFYQSDETYKFPRCMEIDPYVHCYTADSSCRSNKTSSAVTRAMEATDVTFFSRANKTLASNSNNTVNKITIIIPSVVLVLGVVCIVVAVIIKRRKVNCKVFLDVCDTEKNREDAEMPLLIHEAEIKRLEFDYLLQELPTDPKSILEIAKILKIPPEIVSWRTENRQQFVRSMKKGSIAVYSGRGMVIGCAGAGKTTLVKKLKGEKNPATKPTKGIEIHVHEFKLNAEENTIKSCKENEKNKGCLCVTPSAGDHKREVNIENKEQSENENEGKNPKTNRQNSEQTYEKTINTGENTSSASKEKDVSPSVQDDTTFNANTLIGNTWNSFDFHKKINEFLQQWDFSDCGYSANEDNLKMLSLLDFAGQSAYYACHHIFFSPRAFYILVVDASKNLNSKAIEACDKEGLIYSDWTYANYIQYWLGSIHTYGSDSAPVILVASHSKDEETGGEIRTSMVKEQTVKEQACVTKMMYGNQPDGYMKISRETKGFIQVYYSFNDGTQRDEHPNPGQRYLGTSRTYYLPDNEKGCIVAKLLRVAFHRKLVFTVGYSRTTGINNCVILNGIHLKSSISGGPENFGYLDPAYLDRVLEELAAMGVTQDDLHELEVP